jgi:hypothetical protein
MTDTYRLRSFPWFDEWQAKVDAGSMEGVNHSAGRFLFGMAMDEIDNIPAHQAKALGVDELAPHLWPHPYLAALKCHYAFDRGSTYALYCGWWETLACFYYLQNVHDYSVWLAEHRANIVYVKVAMEEE